MEDKIDNEVRRNISDALAYVEKCRQSPCYSMDKSNDAKKQVAIFDDARDRITIPSGNISFGQALIHKGLVEKISRGDTKTKTRMLFLFDNCLIFTKKSKQEFKYRNHLSLYLMEIKVADDQKIVIKTPEGECTIRISSPSDFQTWIYALTKAIKAYTKYRENIEKMFETTRCWNLDGFISKRELNDVDKIFKKDRKISKRDAKEENALREKFRKAADGKPDAAEKAMAKFSTFNKKMESSKRPYYDYDDGEDMFAKSRRRNFFD